MAQSELGREVLKTPAAKVEQRTDQRLKVLRLLRRP
jgi:hypothetical protein